MVTVAAYLPPNCPVGRGRASMEFVAGAISEAKRRFDDPLIVLVGDFNQWKIEDHLADFPDLMEHPVGVTRGQRCIDRIFTNIPGVVEEGTVPPPWRE